MSDTINNQAQLPLFIAIYEDENCFVGGNSYFQTKWLEIPFKKLKRVFYKLPTNDYICLDERYDSYYYIVEATKDILRMNKNRMEKLNCELRIEYIYFLAKKDNKIISYRVSLINKLNERYHRGDITIRIFDENDKFIKGLNPDGWR